ncbi:hypothetical protein ABZ863_18430 [Saccharomonospora sp. NPDC046836]|uniref:hypothetical protein n=1 Tax=Saccharomonospora sp. NPDC046836 TaxID=3156921 RepID=UPI0033E10545
MKHNRGRRLLLDTGLRPREDPAWTTHALDGGHNLMRDVPSELLKVLLDIAS